MKKRVFLVAPGPDLKEYRKYAGPFVQLHEQTIDRIKGSDTEVVFKQCLPGFWKAPHTVVDYFMNALAVPPICKVVIEAEQEGAEAVIIVCTDDPGLRFARQLVDIPVIGELESTLHLACMMGHKFGVLSWPTRPFMARAELWIRMYGLEAKAIPNPIEPVLEPSPTAEKELALSGYTDPAGFCQKYFVPAAQKLLKRGAEVIVMDSTGLSLIAENARFTQIDGAPVLNVVSVSLKMAEMMVDLRRALGMPSVSRVGLYQKVDMTVKKEDLAQIREYFEKDWQSLPMPEIPAKK